VTTGLDSEEMSHSDLHVETKESLGSCFQNGPKHVSVFLQAKLLDSGSIDGLAVTVAKGK
jgi:hypothetical protein